MLRKLTARTAWIGHLVCAIWLFETACRDAQPDFGRNPGAAEMAHVSPENFSRTSAHDFERRRCADGSGILITAGAIGPAKIGSRISSIRENCTTRIVIRGGDSTLVISPAGGDVELTLSVGDSIVTRAETSDPAFRTEDGFGVGTKLAELRSKYGPACGVADTTAAFPALPGIVFHGRRDVEVIVAGESSGCK